MLRVPVTPQDHLQGDPAAPVTLVEYGDYQCPHCGRAHPVVQRIRKHFGDRLAFVFRNFPLRDMHPQAEPAAETAEFAAANGHFWPMHDALFENQQSLSVPLLLELSAVLKLPQRDLESALAAHTYEPRIRADFLGGVRSGVNGTPTFFINAERHDAPFDYDHLLAAIDARL